MKNNMGIALHNHFDFELTDSRTGKKKAVAQAENVVTYYWYHYALRGLIANTTSGYGLGIALGSGTGTPAPTDNDLFSYAFTGMISTSNGGSYPAPSSNVLEKIIDNGKHIGYKMTRVWVFPATSAYTGVLTEVGLVKNYYSKSSSGLNELLSHAMLKDAEGNEIAITKTDLDILTVTVTAYLTVNMQFTNPIEYGTKFMYWLANLFRFTTTYEATTGCSLGSSWSTYYDYIRNIAFITDIASSLNAESTKDCRATYGSSVAPAYTSRQLSAVEEAPTCVSGVIISCASVRLGTDAGNNCVINGLGYRVGSAVPDDVSYPSLFLPFPNTEVFPELPLSDLHVGTGDGTTVEFAPAVPLFIKDSDVVYVNGVQQTRGIDYTIDNNGTGRYDCSPGVIITNMQQEDVSNIYIPSDYNGIDNAYGDRKRSYVVFPFSGLQRSDVACGITSKSVWSIASPLTFELRDDPTIGHKVNGVTIPNFLYNVNLFSASDNVYFILECSTDKEHWQEVIKVPMVNYAVNTAFTFDTVEAKYWRIRSELVSGAEPTIDQLKSALGITMYINSNSYSNACTMGYKGHGIVFTNPPAEGDIITMDATLDRPYKTENNVLDVAFEFKLAADLGA